MTETAHGTLLSAQLRFGWGKCRPQGGLDQSRQIFLDTQVSLKPQRCPLSAPVPNPFFFKPSSPSSNRRVDSETLYQKWSQIHCAKPLTNLGLNTGKFSKGFCVLEKGDRRELPGNLDCPCKWECEVILDGQRESQGGGGFTAAGVNGLRVDEQVACRPQHRSKRM